MANRQEGVAAIDHPLKVEMILVKLRHATELALGYPSQAISRSEAHILLDHIEERERTARVLEDARDDWYAREKKIKAELRDLRAIVRGRAETREARRKATS